jgi:hypothetical protein
LSRVISPQRGSGMKNIHKAQHSLSAPYMHSDLQRLTNSHTSARCLSPNNGRPAAL